MLFLSVFIYDLCSIVTLLSAQNTTEFAATCACVLSALASFVAVYVDFHAFNACNGVVVFYCWISVRSAAVG